MKTLLSLFATLSFFHNIWGSASHIQIRGSRRAPIQPGLGRRATIWGEVGLRDVTNIEYNTNITVNGVPFSVIIDTGSSDLYVCSTEDVPGAVDTGTIGGVTYAVGSVQGPIELATVEFADYAVKNQAFIMCAADDATHRAGTGLIGLGPSAGSNVAEILYFATGSINGNTTLDNIFLQNTSTPNFITILLGRSDDPENLFPGDLTVGATLPQYSNVTAQPKLNVTNTPGDDTDNQHWQVLLDAPGVFVNGASVSATTIVPSTSNADQLTAVFDSGFSLPQVPKSVSDAIYSAVSGAKYTNDPSLGGVWIVPCKAEINITFSFGGEKVPIHPLDASLLPTDLDMQMDSFVLDDGELGCIGAFQPMSFDGGNTFDMVLGMAFLRNTYTLINFGDFVDAVADIDASLIGAVGPPRFSTAPPYVQLLPLTTDAAAAHQDFVTARANLGAAGPSKENDLSTQVHLPSVSWRPSLPVAIGIAVAVVVLLVGIVVCVRVRRARRRHGSRGVYQPVMY